MSSEPRPLLIGRYALFDPIASGGMATVHIARLLGAVGFSRTVAIKRLHQWLAGEPEFVKMFIDEARLAARIQHPNVVPTIDVVSTNGELFLVMDFVQGESLARLVRLLHEKNERMPLPMATAILSGALHGLHAAHEAKDESGADLAIVHRDVSPQNVLVGVDGLARVLDFGVAKAAGRLQTTREGQVKGKLAYMAPEQVQAKTITRAADIYAASVVAWEVLAGARLFQADSEASVLAKVLSEVVAPPSSSSGLVPPELDAVVMRGLSRDPSARFATAKEMANALEKCVPPASLSEVAEWVAPIIGPTVKERAALVARMEAESSSLSAASAPEETRREGAMVAAPAAPTVRDVPVEPAAPTVVGAPPPTVSPIAASVDAPAREATRVVAAAPVAPPREAEPTLISATAVASPPPPMQAAPPMPPAAPPPPAAVATAAPAQREKLPVLPMVFIGAVGLIALAVAAVYVVHGMSDGAHAEPATDDPATPSATADPTPPTATHAGSPSKPASAPAHPSAPPPRATTATPVTTTAAPLSPPPTATPTVATPPAASTGHGHGHGNK